MAKTIEVLLTDNVLKLGSMGDVVSVRAGYARNYLLPYGMAIQASTAAKRQIEVLRERASKEDAVHVSSAEGLKKKLTGISLTIGAKVSHDDHLFGSVGIRDILTALAEKGFSLDPKNVHLHESWKTLGSYTVELGLHKSVILSIDVTVVDSDPQGKSMKDTLAEASANDDKAEGAKS